VWNFTTAAGGTNGTPCPGVPTVAYAGKTYHTVQIGSQCWLKENLNVGKPINGSSNQTNNGIIEKYCYNDDTANCTTYGGLYQWAEAVQYKNGATNTNLANPPLTGNIQGICPSGWHLPTGAEFVALSTQVSGNGNSLKAIGQGTGLGAGTNTSGFSALLGGICFYNIDFMSLGETSGFWGFQESDWGYGYIMRLDNNVSNVYDETAFKIDGQSVRCVKD